MQIAVELLRKDEEQPNQDLKRLYDLFDSPPDYNGLEESDKQPKVCLEFLEELSKKFKKLDK